jgi:ribosomal protein S18 acetylase RimI-like enzyme
MTDDVLAIRPFRETDRDALIRLWRRADLLRPWNDPDRDIDRKLALADDLLLVAHLATDRDETTMVGTVMLGYDGHRGSIGYLAVDPDHQGRGHGGRLLATCEDRLLAMGCPKVNLLVRRSNAGVVAFYERHGYAVDDVAPLGKRLIADGGP